MEMQVTQWSHWDSKFYLNSDTMLKKNHLLTILAVAYISLLNIASFAQTDNNSVKLSTGFGYFDPMAAGEKGNILYSKLVFKLPTGLYVGASIGSSLIFNELDSVIGFRGERTYEHYFLYSLVIEKEFLLGENNHHQFTLGSGLVFEEVKYSRPEIFIQSDGMGGNDLIINIIRSNTNQNNLGSFIEANYLYQFSKLSIGLRLKSNILFDIGLGGFLIAPNISIAL